jgi:hypothetical protein
MIKDEFGNRRFYGMYRAIVVDNSDPSSSRRLRLKIPQVLHEEITGWAWESESGISIGLPSAGEGVWVMFESGDPSFPVWMGTYGSQKTSNSIDGGSA